MLKYGEALKYQREINGLSMLELAKQINTSHQNISRWENGLVLPNIDFCVQLADFYGITVDELIGRDTISQNKKAAVIYHNSTHNGNNNF